MSHLLRRRCSSLALSLAAWLSIPLAAQASHQKVPDDQILWQRSLDDARALAAATGKPLLIAVNMDGESASERIVRELYRDPEFVALTRRCVCVVASVFRHSARDHDAQGRRIPCPRLGVVTCGEHMALEPLLHESYLADGERVAPRHALILPSGKKAWDLSLCFDLRDVERALAKSLRELAGPSWAAMVRRRDQLGRTALETALARTTRDDQLLAALAALHKGGDAGALGALRVVVAKLPGRAGALGRRLVEVARALGLQKEVAAALREQLRAGGEDPGAPDLAARRALLPLVAALDGQAPAVRTWLLAQASLAGAAAAARRALGEAFGAEGAAALQARLAECGGPVSMDAALRLAADGAPAGAANASASASDAMPSSTELLDQLDHLDALPAAEQHRPENLARLAKASLDLARRRMAAGEQGADALLQDAARSFSRALEAEPQHAGWWIERARTAYFLGHFDDQVTYGCRALELTTGRTGRALPDATEPGIAAVLAKPDAVEALRWIGDGHARQLAARAGGDPVAELTGLVEGLRALADVAASPSAGATDWVSLASFCNAIGLPRTELAVLETAAARLPAVADLRQQLNHALWNAGRIESAPAVAERIARQRPASPDALWFAGYAWILVAEQRRRCQQADPSLAAYRLARARFARTAELEPRFADSCRYYTAMTWMGSGMAHLLADRQSDAADCLEQAVRTGADLTQARDGLDRDALDLVDEVLEWRERGPSPVDPGALLDRIQIAAPGSPFWAVAVADAELRESLRADGRNPERVERDTVDAGGNPIRMPMGLPTAAGDIYLQASIAAARRALQQSSTAETRRTLAQSLTIRAERELLLDRQDGVAAALAEAAPLLDLQPPAEGADVDALRALAAQLRERLGDPRPKLRPGR